MPALCVAVLMHLAVTTDEPPPPPPPPPSGLDQPPPPAPTTEAQPQEPPSAASKARRPPAKPAGWARGAAYLGFGLAAAVLVLAITTDIVYPASGGDSTAAVAVGVPGAILTAAGGPIIFVGARSARFDPGIKGSTLLRVFGWIGYAGSLVAWFAAFVGGRGAASVAGVLGAGSFISFGVDGILCAQEADDLASIMTQAPPADGVQISPRFSMLRYRGEVSPVIGLQGVF
jgi:hypothetical protein